MHKTTNHRTPAAIEARLIVLVKPMLPIMAAAIVMGVAGHFCATFITIFGGFAAGWRTTFRNWPALMCISSGSVCAWPVVSS